MNILQHLKHLKWVTLHRCTKFMQKSSLDQFFFLQPCILSHFVFSLENCNLRHCWLDNGKYLVKHKFKLQAVDLLGKTSQFHQCFMIVIITLSTLYFAFLIHAIFSLEMMMMMMMKMMMMIMIKMMMITMMMMMKARRPNCKCRND